MIARRVALCALVLCVVCALVVAPACAGGKGNPNPGVMPITAKVAGLSYSKWSDRWYQWRVSIAGAINPILDLTGENAWVGQAAGPVLILADAWYTPEAQAERWVTVSGDKHLLLPVATMATGALSACLDADGKCPDGHVFAEVGNSHRTCLKDCVDDLTGVFASVDGHPLKDLASYRVEPGVVNVMPYPADNLWSFLGYPWPDAGVLCCEITSGYYVMLAPLPKGEHTVVYGASLPHLNMSYHVTYHITVR